MIYDIHTSVAICKGCNAFLLPYHTKNPIFVYYLLQTQPIFITERNFFV